jgi:hypothetical protein
VILVGIDPGTNTGFATWDPLAFKLGIVEAVQLHRALESVAALQATIPLGSLLVMFEDCRLLRMRGGRMAIEEGKYGSAVLQGVGSVKRDCNIWEEFLEDKGIPYRSKLPTKASLKWSAEKFEAITKWGKRTNGHARDAAVIVYGMNRPIAEGLVRVWLEDRDRKLKSTGTSSPKGRSRASPPAPRSTIATDGSRTPS